MELGDAGLEVALRLFGGIVFGIFGEVALVARLGYGGGGGRAVEGYEVVQLVFELLQSFFAVIIDF